MSPPSTAPSFYFPRPPILDEIPREGHVVIEASAGTGKTWLLEHLIIDLLINRNASLDEILVVTFTEKATQEMRHRVRAKLEEMWSAQHEDSLTKKPHDPENYWALDQSSWIKLHQTLINFNAAPIFTIHGFCSRMLRDTAFLSGHLLEQTLVAAQPSFHAAFMQVLRKCLLSSHSHFQLIKSSLEHFTTPQIETLLWKWHQEPGAKMPEADSTSLEMLHASSTTKPAQIRALLIHHFLPLIQQQLHLQKTLHGEHDFDDILNFVEEIIHGPGGELFLNYVRENYTYGLADEFQDTDSTQWNIFKKIFTESRKDRPDSTKHQLFLIGDPKQAIYSFRGADVHTYLSAVDHIENTTHGKKILLTENYRSTPALVAGYNQILAHGFFEGPIKYTALKAKQTSLDIVDTSGKTALPIEIWHFIGLPKLRANEIRDALGKCIAKEIHNIVCEKNLIAKNEEQSRNIEFKDIFILTRTFSEAEKIANELNSQSIPCSLNRNLDTSANQEAKDIYALLQAIEQPENQSACTAALLTPFFNMRLEEVARLDWDAPNSPITFFKEWKKQSEKSSLAIFAKEVIRQTKIQSVPWESFKTIFEELIQQNPGTPFHLPRILSQLRSWIEHPSAPLNQRIKSPESNAVQILTMHKAKGLEAEVVFLAGGFSKAPRREIEPKIYHQNHQRFAWIGAAEPEIAEQIKREEQQEDERLLYVALTRAKRKLYLPYFGPPPSSQLLLKEKGQFNFAYLNGSYKPLNDRLRELVLKEDVTNTSALFGYAPVWVKPIVHKKPLQDPEQNTASVKTVTATEPLQSQNVLFESLKENQTGFKVTSYTKLKHEQQAQSYTPPWLHHDFGNNPSENQKRSENTLPKGAETGIFLHELLESIFNHKQQFSTELKTPSSPTLFFTEPWHSLFQQEGQKHQVGQSLIEQAKAMITKTLFLPIEKPNLHLPQGLFELSHFSTEVQIDFPLQMQQHKPRLLAKSIVDLLFVENEKIWFADWKSDFLNDWSAQTVQTHIHENYQLQIRLYTLGIIQWLGIESPEDYDQRFGGAMYCFLRGMAEEKSSAIYIEKPSWMQIEQWKKDPTLIEDKTL